MGEKIMNVDVDIILRSLHYYAKNHPRYKSRVKKELKNWQNGTVIRKLIKEKWTLHE